MSQVDTFLIFALALNFLWLPSIILMFLDMILAMGCSEDRYQLLLIEYAKQLDTTRNKLCRWLFVPLGWVAGAYFLTEGFGCMAFVNYAACLTWGISD